jgi:acetyltransferase-like isoleucine patch superfamily enzyme
MSRPPSLLARIKNWVRFQQDPIAYFRGLGVQIGKGTKFYGPNRRMFSSEPYLVKIGQDCHITPDVSFVPHDDSVLIFQNEDPTLDLFAPIIVGDRVFIGTRSTILLGVTIGSDCIVAAGSVVTQDVPSGTIVGGVPSKPIGRVDDYRKKALLRSTGTKGMTADQKRRRLLELFRDRLGQQP